MTPPPSSASPSRDEDHLRLLTVFHYVCGGLAALCFCFPLIHVALGVALVVGGNSIFGNSPNPPPPFLGWMFIIIGGVCFLLGQTLAVGILINGRLLAKRRRHMTAMVLAGVECLFMPFGTILGVFTLVTLMRPEVKLLFDPPASR